MSAQEWQPIETAPKDGTRFLGFWADAPSDVSVREMSCGYVQRLKNPVLIWRGSRADKHHVTHWMPLPEPPK